VLVRQTRWICGDGFRSARIWGAGELINRGEKLPVLKNARQLRKQGQNIATG